MENAKVQEFIVLDDDSVNNFICKKVIQLTFPGSLIHTFVEPEDGLDFIMAEYSKESCRKVLFFLDINMPNLNGWEVLERLEAFPEQIKQQITIYMLSSSVNPEDKDQAELNTLVSGYLVKPLSQKALKSAVLGAA